MSIFATPKVMSSCNTLVNNQPTRVVVIDDHDFSRTLIVDLMTLEGYQVTEFDSGSCLNLVESISTIQPDLILLDIILSDTDGFEVCQELRHNKTTQFIPVMFVSALIEPQFKVKAKATGGNDFLNKPINPAELSLKAKNLITHKKLDDGIRKGHQILLSLAEIIETKISSVEPKNSALENLEKLVYEFGQYLDLSQKQIEYLKLAAQLHNIGLVKVQDEILFKKSPLTPEERKKIQEHVTTGEKICQSCCHDEEVLLVIRHHHERHDGQGYPDGLMGQQIPYLAQVFQVVDIYCALTSQRPHRKAFTSGDALQILLEEANEGWRNPKLVQKFCMFMKKPLIRGLDQSLLIKPD